MARKKIREYDAKSLFVKNVSSQDFNFDHKAILVDPSTNLDKLPSTNSWISTDRLVVKPDQMFGKRGKHGLVLVNADFSQVKEFIRKYMQKTITLGKITDSLTHFLIEPFIDHKNEYYLAINSVRDGLTVHFSQQGGVDIEENWNSVRTMVVRTGQEAHKTQLADLVGSVSEKPILISFIQKAVTFCMEYDFSYLEFNPFTIDGKTIYLLDAVAEVDSCASFKNLDRWENLDFPEPFGKKRFPEEKRIRSIDRDSGASLKLTILNPNGRIWNILSGGGASVVCLDEIACMGKADEIANYGEYSGNPSTQESYSYASTILDLMTRTKNPRGKILLIAGGIANFTDVEKTFRGVSSALKDHAEKLRETDVQVIIRRGGPNDTKGLSLIKQVGEEIGIPMQIFGPETPMTQPVQLIGGKL